MSSHSGVVSRDHKAIVREEFTRQAQAYARAAVISDQARLGRLLAALRLSGGERALEVASGPGYVAMALATRCREVIGVDLTEAPVKIAEQTRQQRALTNVSFRLADAENLPYGNAEFDLAVCRFAFHHFEHPARVLAEMCRVCRADAIIAVEDLYSSEVPRRAAFYNHFERLRDPSHTRALPLSEMIAMLTGENVAIDRLYSDEMVTDVEGWLASAQTSPQDAAEVRRLLEEDIGGNLSGSRPFRRAGALAFHHRTVALVGRLTPRA